MRQKLNRVTFISNENTKKPKYMKNFPVKQPNLDPIVKLKMHRVYNLFLLYWIDVWSINLCLTFTIYVWGTMFWCPKSYISQQTVKRFQNISWNVGPTSA